MPKDSNGLLQSGGDYLCDYFSKFFYIYPLKVLFAAQIGTWLNCSILKVIWMKLYQTIDPPFNGFANFSAAHTYYIIISLLENNSWFGDRLPPAAEILHGRNLTIRKAIIPKQAKCMTWWEPSGLNVKELSLLFKSVILFPIMTLGSYDI